MIGSTRATKWTKKQKQVGAELGQTQSSLVHDLLIFVVFFVIKYFGQKLTFKRDVGRLPQLFEIFLELPLTRSANVKNKCFYFTTLVGSVLVFLIVQRFGEDDL